MPHDPIPGTHLFDSTAARRGYALNRMCYSFNEARNRAAFRSDETAFGAAPSYRSTAEGWGLPTIAPVAGHRELSRRTIEGAVEGEFDITTSQAMAIDHAVPTAERTALRSGARLPLGRTTAGCWFWRRAGCHTNWTENAPASSIRRLTRCAWTPSPTIRSD